MICKNKGQSSAPSFDILWLDIVRILSVLRIFLKRIHACCVFTSTVFADFADVTGIAMDLHVAAGTFHMYV